MSDEENLGTPAILELFPPDATICPHQPPSILTWQTPQGGIQAGRFWTPCVGVRCPAYSPPWLKGDKPRCMIGHGFDLPALGAKP